MVMKFTAFFRWCMRIEEDLQPIIVKSMDMIGNILLTACVYIYIYVFVVYIYTRTWLSMCIKLIHTYIHTYIQTDRQTYIHMSYFSVHLYHMPHVIYTVMCVYDVCSQLKWLYRILFMHLQLELSGTTQSPVACSLRVRGWDYQM